MPEICRFYGIVIKMFFLDHNPPHFHVEYGDSNAIFDIQTLAIIEGNLPPRAIGLVMEWASMYKDALIELWNKAANSEALNKLPPLQ